ncbi:unnamed protein product, partial [Choristocarpus tenellus]
CYGNDDYSIDWDCVLGPGSLDEVTSHGGRIYPCSDASSSTPCTTFDVDEDDERAEVKVNSNTDQFKFYEDEEWVIRYSFRPESGMKVADKFTHIGQLKGSKGEGMLDGDALCSITANSEGLNVRFSNQGGSIDDFIVDGSYLDWEDALGEWTHVKITAIFGQEMKVELSGAVSDIKEWPSDKTPVAWSDKSMDSVRLKLGVYHSEDDVGDARVDYRDVSIVGP